MLAKRKEASDPLQKDLGHYWDQLCFVLSRACQKHAAQMTVAARTEHFSQVVSSDDLLSHIRRHHKNKICVICGSVA